MGTVVEAAGLSKHFGDIVALEGCEFAIPGGKVTGLVGPNGAGKTTLLQLAVGLRRPTAGSIRVLDHDPGADEPALLEQIGFIAQDRPLYGDFTIADTLELARRLNTRWDAPYALARIQRFGLPLNARVRRLSTGQRAQVALALALGKRPALLLLDEPVANLDPLARLDLLEELMAVVAEGDVTVLMSANALADIERVCEHIVMLMGGHVRMDGEIEDLVAQHLVVSGPREPSPLDPSWRVIEARVAERQGTWLVHATNEEPGVEHANGVVTRRPTLEEIVLAYLRAASMEAKR